MSLKTATMFAMVALGLAIGLRFLLLLQSMLQFADINGDTSGGSIAFSFAITAVLHFVTDLLAYGGLLVFLFVLWTKQQPQNSI